MAVKPMRQRKTFIRPIDAILQGHDLDGGAAHLIDAGWLVAESDTFAFGEACGGVVGISVERGAVAWVVSGPCGPLREGRLVTSIAPLDAEPGSACVLGESLARALCAAAAHLPGGRLAAVGVAWPGPVGLDGEPLPSELHQRDLLVRGAEETMSMRPLVETAIEAAMPAAELGGEGDRVAIEVINDADADLLYEAHHGVARGFPNVFGVKVGEGLGLAILQDGRLVRGHSGGAGRIEHVKVQAETAPLTGDWDSVIELDELPPCWCDGRECVARFATGKAIVEQLKSYDLADLTYAERAQLIERDCDRDQVKAVCGRAGRLLGQALLGMVMALDPGRVVVKAFPENPHLLRGLRTSLTEGTPILLGPQDIVAASPGVETTAAGAARLMVEQVVVPRMESALSPSSARVQRRDLPTWLRTQVPADVDDLDLYSPRYGLAGFDAT